MIGMNKSSGKVLNECEEVHQVSKRMRFRHRLRQVMDEKFKMFYFRFHFLGLKMTLKFSS